jgi:hypothetical protein
MKLEWCNTFEISKRLNITAEVYEIEGEYYCRLLCLGKKITPLIFVSAENVTASDIDNVLNKLMSFDIGKDVFDE